MNLYGVQATAKLLKAVYFAQLKLTFHEVNIHAGKCVVLMQNSVPTCCINARTHNTYTYMYAHTLQP